MQKNTHQKQADVTTNIHDSYQCMSRFDYYITYEE